MRNMSAEDRAAIDIAELLDSSIPKFTRKFFNTKKIAKKIMMISRDYVDRKIDERIHWRLDLLKKEK